MRILGLLLCVLCGFAFSSAAFAENLRVTARDVVAIMDGRGSARILFRLPDLEGLTDAAISRAVLRVPLAAGASTRRVTLLIHPVTRAWSEGVGWSDGWSRAGGDFDQTLFARAEVDLGSSTTDLVFDLTTIAKEIVEDGAANDGFVLTAYEGEALAAADLPLLQGLGAATLDLRYRSTTRYADETRGAARRTRATGRTVEDGKPDSR